MEIYAVEIQMHNETKNYKKLKVVGSLSLIRNELTEITGDLQCI